MRDLLIVFADFLLVVVFLEAFVSHVKHPDRLRSVISKVIASGAKPIALVVTAADLGIALTLPVSPQVGASLAATYLLAVTLPLVVAWRNGKDLQDCGCGATPHSVGPRLFARNAVLLSLSGLLIAAPTPDSLGVQAIAGVASGAIVLIAVAAVRRFMLTDSAGMHSHSGPSRRTVLRGGVGLAIASALSLLPESTFGLTRLAQASANSKNATSRIGGPGAPLVVSVRRALESAPRALALVRDARVDWLAAGVWRTERENARLAITTTTVLAPIVDSSGRRLGRLMKHSGNAVIKRPDEVTGVSLEERIQLIFGSPNDTVQVMIGDDGQLERIDYHKGRPPQVSSIQEPSPDYIDPGGGGCWDCGSWYTAGCLIYPLCPSWSWRYCHNACDGRNCEQCYNSGICCESCGYGCCDAASYTCGF